MSADGWPLTFGGWPLTLQTLAGCLSSLSRLLSPTSKVAWTFFTQAQFPSSVTGLKQCPTGTVTRSPTHVDERVNASVWLGVNQMAGLRWRTTETGFSVMCEPSGSDPPFLLLIYKLTGCKSIILLCLQTLFLFYSSSKITNFQLFITFHHKMIFLSPNIPSQGNDKAATNVNKSKNWIRFPSRTVFVLLCSVSVLLPRSCFFKRHILVLMRWSERQTQRRRDV